MDAILMMSAKLATLGVLKIKVFWNKDYDAIVSVHDVASKSSPVTLLYCKCGHVTIV